jgi:hypothetical protein
MKKLNIKISAKDVWKNGKAVKLYVFISLGDKRSYSGDRAVAPSPVAHTLPHTFQYQN